MPKTVKSKRSYKRKTKSVKRMARTMVKTQMFKKEIHHFKRWGEGVTFTDNNGGDGAGIIFNDGLGSQYWLTLEDDSWGTFTFQLNNLPNYQELCSLFDQYRINKVCVKLFPTSNVNQIVPTAGGVLPGSVLTQPIMYVVDYDDKVFTGRKDLLEYGKLKYCKYPKVMSSCFTPALLDSVSATGTNVSVVAGSPKFKQWLSTDDPDIQHFGLKVFMPGVGGGITSTDNVWRYEIRIAYYVSFRNTK